MRQKTAPGFLEQPSSGEKEHAESDEAEGAPHLVEEIAEIEPGYGCAETDDTEVDQSAARLSNSPPDEEDAKGSNERMGDEVGLSLGVRAVVVVAVVISLNPDAHAPGQSDDECDGSEHGNRAFAESKQREEGRDGGDDHPAPNSSMKRRIGLHARPRA